MRRASEAFLLGDVIQHVSGSGSKFVITSIDSREGTCVARSEKTEIVVINPDNWRIVEDGKDA